MKYQRQLSDLYQLYTTGKLSRKDFEGRIFRYLLDNFDRYHIFNRNKNRWDEFLSWLYPRLVRAIDLYRDMGSSFDAYITSLIHYTAKEYRCREADHRLTEYMCWQARAEEMMACESESEYPDYRKDVSIPQGIKPRQILLLLLKSYHLVSDEYVKHVARKIGMNTALVMNMVNELRDRRSKKENEILDLRDRIYCQHYRCLAYQKRMDASQPGTAYYERMKDRYERARKRFCSMKKRLGRIRQDASNSLIAQVVGIPKGTVDSGLFSVRKQLGNRKQV